MGTNWLSVGDRLVEHAEHGTTDNSENLVTVPASYYLNQEQWEAEMRNIFDRLPLMFAFSCEMREIGSYRSLTLRGKPVIAVRGGDGVVRAFLNVCTHRGTLLMPEGNGKCSRIVCPYHSWAYDLEGDLAWVQETSKFGDFDKSDRGLTELPCEEIAGLIFVILTPGLSIDMPQYLGGALEQWRVLELEQWHVYERRVLRSVNWKIVYDGYHDGYHIASVHPTTVGSYNANNITTFDAYGPHQRIGFADQDILTIKDKPWEERGPVEGFNIVLTLFPNTSSAWWPGEGGLFTQIIPGPTPGESTTIQTFFRAELPETPEAKREVDDWVDLLHRTVRDEDYKVVGNQQEGLASGAIKEVLFGRNEIGQQRLHAWIRHLSQDNPNPSEQPAA